MSNVELKMIWKQTAVA